MRETANKCEGRSVVLIATRENGLYYVWGQNVEYDGISVVVMTSLDNPVYSTKACPLVWEEAILYDTRR